MDADELLQQTKALAKHMSVYQPSLAPDITSNAAVSESALEELLSECEEKWKELEELQNKVTLTETDTLEDTGYEFSQLMTRVKALTAELNQWQKKEPELLSKNNDVLVAVGKEELQRVNKELEMVLSCCQTKNEKLNKDLKSEQKWLEEQEELLKAVTDKAAELQNEVMEFSESRAMQELKVKINKVIAYRKKLLENLGEFIEEHFPLPQQQRNARKKDKNVPQEPTADLISLHEILELLMNKILQTPHEPYLTIDNTFWPPYVEMLLRYGVALRHPEDPNRIRMEAFHQ
ncbi:centromere protein K-like [Acipenser oxyrinchus oxyrinchus]|uniref:Centromere protein K-like n=1 Tax=Acipenser oxyrinchus oxyrinchus TaxID=40147 RepID=A0AAD8LPV5_ACIOX|nr:centromere protein K-like [Acipenser oxyrinchus oxyrinchus]